MGFLINPFIEFSGLALLAYYEDGTDDLTIGSTVIPRRAIKLETAESALLGLNAKKISLSIRKLGSPTGTITLNIRNSSDTIKITMGTYDIATLTTSYAWIDFENLTGYTLAQDDRISLEFGGGTWASNVLRWEGDTTSDGYDGDNTTQDYYNGSIWIYQADHSPNFRLYG